MTHNTIRSPTLGDVLDIYNFDFYGDTSHRDFVKESDTCRRTDSPHPVRPKNRPHVYIPNSQGGTEASLMKAIHNRTPVYYGRDMSDESSPMFNWQRVQDVFGYTRDDILQDAHAISETRYAIAGPILVMPSGTSARGSEPSRAMRSHMVHVWGVNLESPTTADYKALIDDILTNNCEKFYSRQLELYRLVVSSSLHMARLNDCNAIDIQMPIIGSGCFLKSLEPKEKHNCMKNIVNGIIRVSRELPDHVRLKICIYNPAELQDSFVTTFRAEAQRNPRFSVGEGSVDGNVLNNVPESRDGNLSVVVNAWDTRSLIGNGGNMDYSVDGFAVANAGGYNTQFRNTSYLHNAIFNPHFKDPRTWISV